MEELPKIKILRNNGKSERIFIDEKEIKGVTSIKIKNSTTNEEDEISIVVEIGFIKSLEIFDD